MVGSNQRLRFAFFRKIFNLRWIQGGQVRIWDPRTGQSWLATTARESVASRVREPRKLSTEKDDAELTIH